MQYGDLPINASIIEAAIDDLPGVMSLIAVAIQQMESEEIHQWDTIYPDCETFASDIDQHALFVFKHDGAIRAVMALDDHQPDEYRSIDWRYPAERVLVVHRLAVHPSYQRRGMARQMMAYAEQYGHTGGYDVIRLDAFIENPRAVALYEQQGYQKAGHIRFRKGLFGAFEKQLSCQGR